MLRTLWKVVKRWQGDEAGMLAAAVSYYIALSLFPVLLILTSGLGAFFKWTHLGNDARDYLIQVISDQAAPSLATAVEQSLAHVQDYSSLSGPIGMVILLFAALAIFAQFERAFDRIWKVSSPEKQTAWASIQSMLTDRLRAFAMLCGLGLLLVGVFVVGVIVAALESRLRFADAAWAWWGLELVVGVGINALAFTTLYRYLPKIRVRWQEAARGGLFAAIVWEVGRQLVASLVIGQHYTSAYGIIGGFLAIMLWGYYAVSVIFLGAELVQLLGESRPVETRHAVLRRPAMGAPRVAFRLPSFAGRWLDLAFAGLLLYVGLFLGLSRFRAQEVVLLPGAAKEQVVRFSDNATLHRFARLVFAPLISSLPGPYLYAVGKQDAADCRRTLVPLAAQQPSG